MRETIFGKIKKLNKSKSYSLIAYQKQDQFTDVIKT